jgi:hypothetical protein
MALLKFTINFIIGESLPVQKIDRIVILFYRLTLEFTGGRTPAVQRGVSPSFVLLRDKDQFPFDPASLEPFVRLARV